MGSEELKTQYKNLKQELRAKNEYIRTLQDELRETDSELIRKITAVQSQINAANYEISRLEELLEEG